MSLKRLNLNTVEPKKMVKRNESRECRMKDGKTLMLTITAIVRDGKLMNMSPSTRNRTPVGSGMRKDALTCQNLGRLAERPMITHALVCTAGPLWDEATRAPFLGALAAGSLPLDAFRRWLAQDYLFAEDLTAFQAILLAKSSRDCHKPLIGGLAALDKELDWFESHAAHLQVGLDSPPHPICRRYTDFLLRCAYTQPYPVLLAMLFGVEASYLAAWSALAPTGPYAEFIERWSTPDFAAYVEVLGGLAERHPHAAAQEHFNQVLVHEREFWKMAWKG